MTNNTNTSAAYIYTTWKEVDAMTKNDIRKALLKVGIELSNSKFKNTKKDVLLDILNPYIVIDEESEAENDLQEYYDTHEESDTAKTDDSSFAKSEDYLNALVKDIAFRILSDTLLTDKDGFIRIVKDKSGKVALKSNALFFRPTKVSVEKGTYMVLTKRLWAVLKDECTKFCAKHDDLKNVTEDIAKQTIESAIDLMIKNDILTAIKVERNYIKLDPKTMEQEEKDVLNALWKKGGVKTQKLAGKDEGKILTTALNDEGKKVLNELYPCYSYRATAAQMNNMFAIIKSR